MKLIKKEKNLKWKTRNKKSQQSLNHKNHLLNGNLPEVKLLNPIFLLIGEVQL